MIYLVLRQASAQLNHKHVKCPYTVIRLQVTRRNCKKPPLSERKPLDRLGAANHVWSIDLVVDCTVEGRLIKNLTIVDDATY